jgi:hypothetical protein
MNWTYSAANASGQLTPHLDRITAAIDAARKLAAPHLPDISLDVVIQHRPGRVIPGLGHVGFAPTATVIQLTFDTTDADFEANLGAPLTRTVLHELHHIHRWHGPGYGQTLGEALVTEGLAGHFVRQLCDTPPEPWERPIPDHQLRPYLRIARDGWTSGYDHAAWFFGADGHPDHLGYSLGHALVGAFLEDNPADSAASLVHAPASRFETALEALPA